VSRANTKRAAFKNKTQISCGAARAQHVAVGRWQHVAELIDCTQKK